MTRGEPGTVVELIVARNVVMSGLKVYKIRKKSTKLLDVSRNLQIQDVTRMNHKKHEQRKRRAKPGWHIAVFMENVMTAVRRKARQRAGGPGVWKQAAYQRNLTEEMSSVEYWSDSPLT